MKVCGQDWNMMVARSSMKIWTPENIELSSCFEEMETEEEEEVRQMQDIQKVGSVTKPEDELSSTEVYNV